MSVTRLPVVYNPNYKKNGLKSLIYTFNKYNITPQHKSIVSRNAQKQLVKAKADGTSSQVTANDEQNDSFYTVNVGVGTPAQSIPLDFDTGSSDLWLWSTELPAATQTAGKKNGVVIFDSSKSSSFKNKAGSTWQITYGDGSGASGTVGNDNVKIGDITIKGQAIELANKVSSQFQQQGGSGLLGLAFGSINTVSPTPVKTPVEQMIAQDDISKTAELFTAYLGSVKDKNDPDKGASFYTFGKIDQAAVPSGKQIAYTPVDNSQGFWMFDSASGTVNGKTVNQAGNKAIADTGTTLIMASTAFCQAVYGQIQGAQQDQQAGGWVFPASVATADLPTVTVAVGSKQYTINKEHIGYSAADSTGQTIFGSIQDRGDMNFDILGDQFLQNCYVVFDLGNTRFGCVQRSDPTPAGAGSK